MDASIDVAIDVAIDVEIAAALSGGRTVIVPSRQRAAALALCWARARIRAGEALWSTPDILGFDAWLAREWQRARDTHGGPAPQLLSRAQERRIWSQELEALEREGAGQDLGAHVAALMRAASRARRDLVEPHRHAASSEERLLARALERVDRRCAAEGWWIPALARPADLSELAVEAPCFAGFDAVPKLALAIPALAGEVTRPALPQSNAQTRRFIAADARAEVLAAADWCRAQLREDPSRRLLVVLRAGTLDLDLAGAMLWSRLSEGTRAGLGDPPDPDLLTIEGGVPLSRVPLIRDALAALELGEGNIPFAALSRLLLSPWFDVMPAGEAARLECALREWPVSRYAPEALLRALERQAPRVAGSATLAAGLAALFAALDGARAGAGVWAARFNGALRALGFPGRQALDSRDAQRLARWNELLDEFATLEAVSASMSAGQALAQLAQLARHGRHEAASADAAITLTSDAADPVVPYDGIWVMGLNETAWPEPPRPDPFVALLEQRERQWPEASVALRRKQALGELAAWQARTPHLVLSHAAWAGDVHQRASPLIAGFPVQDDHAPEIPASPPDLEIVRDAALPPVDRNAMVRRGLRRLELQHQCAFRAQAEMRLGAGKLRLPPEGIGAPLRGQLLHAALDALWDTLGGHAGLAALDADERATVAERAWHAAERALSLLPIRPVAAACARERTRGVALLQRLMEEELLRAPFVVRERESTQSLELGGLRFNLRIDRIDDIDAQQVVIDYKSGSAPRIDLQADPPEPLQLAVYADALAQAGAAPAGVALLKVSAREVSLAGAAQAGTAAAQGLLPIDDWAGTLRRWHERLSGLAAAHGAGDALVAPLPLACRDCHLQGFCRIQADSEQADE